MASMSDMTVTFRFLRSDLATTSIAFLSAHDQAAALWQRAGAALLLQQLAQRTDAVDACMVPIALEHHQAAACQVERRHGARPLRPPAGDGGGVVGAQRAPALDQWRAFFR